MFRNLAIATAALLTASASCAPAVAQGGPVERAQLVDVLNLDGELFHVQGVDLDRRHIWITSVDLKNHRGYIHEFDRATGRIERRRELTDGARYHPGGISMVGGSIWAPVAEMRPDSSAVLEEIDKSTLKIRRRIFVGDHLGCVAASRDYLVAGNWDSRLLYVFDRHGRRLRVLRNPSPTRYQDMKFVGGDLVASGYLTPLSGAIDWFAWPSMRLLTSRRAGATDRGKPYTGEGMAIKGRDLYLISEDGPSRLFHFRLT